MGMLINTEPLLTAVKGKNMWRRKTDTAYASLRHL
jgi:hypothetical protein